MPKKKSLPVSIIGHDDSLPYKPPIAWTAEEIF